MSLPAFPQAPDGGCGSGGELTRLNCEGQFKPFVYLNGPRGQPLRRCEHGKVPPFGGTSLKLTLRSELAIPIGFLTAGIRLLARLTVGILLLLAGLLAATLLLTGLLARILG